MRGQPQPPRRPRLCAKTGNPRMQERVADLEDIAGQLVRDLTGTDDWAGDEMPDATVLLADGVAAFGNLVARPAEAKAIAVERGGPTSHMAIIAGVHRRADTGRRWAEVGEMLPEGASIAGGLDRRQAGHRSSGRCRRKSSEAEQCSSTLPLDLAVRATARMSACSRISAARQRSMLHLLPARRVAAYCAPNSSSLIGRTRRQGRAS